MKMTFNSYFFRFDGFLGISLDFISIFSCICDGFASKKTLEKSTKKTVVVVVNTDNFVTAA